MIGHSCSELTRLLERWLSLSADIYSCTGGFLLVDYLLVGVFAIVTYRSAVISRSTVRFILQLS